MSRTPRPTAKSTSARAARRRTRTEPTSPVASDRRIRVRLRELCDEVLASYRVASERDLFTDADRLAGQALLRGVLAAKH